MGSWGLWLITVVNPELAYSRLRAVMRTHRPIQFDKPSVQLSSIVTPAALVNNPDGYLPGRLPFVLLYDQ